MNVFYFILVLSFLVIIHEFGHFIVAKLFKVRVEEFGLGYPPRMVKLLKWMGTQFSLNWIPFGGFVKLEGEDLTDDDQRLSKQEIARRKKNKEEIPFYAAPQLGKFLTVLSGPIVNLVYGILAFIIVYYQIGIPVQLKDQARISFVFENSPAAEAGIEEGYNVVALKQDNYYQEINSIDQVIDTTKQFTGEKIIFELQGPCEGQKCQESTKEVQVYVRTDEEKPDNEGAIGIAFSPVVYDFFAWWKMPFLAAGSALKQSWDLMVLIISALGRLFKDLFTQGILPSEVAGPIGIAHLVEQRDLLNTALSIVIFSGELSINLAIMNLLPLPALDGGRALFIFLNKIFSTKSKKIIEKVEGFANYGGFLLLVLLLILISIRDIWKIFQG